METPELENIYNQYYGKVMGYIAARVQRRADAEDLAADVFEKVYRKIGDYDEGKASVSTWIFTITRNTVIDYFRRTRPTEEPDENLASDDEVDENLLSQETLSELAGALRKLPQELQDIVAEHLLHPDLRLGVGDGAEQQVQAAPGREDGAFADETDGGDFGVDLLVANGRAFIVQGHGGLAADGGNGRSGGLPGTALAGCEECGCGNQDEENAECFFHRKN